ncbi:cation diffusion facilitator family transporter [Ornithinibacillus scapharcae]|uniref:cation diffusion facilitator family transporter n=1 Tax=Ornithinibacillus scapharcae TaxID=1147159 RepID=UPI000225AD81|nr:cation diffusion facilitator family transporter [Ornithinibacillus scapharcae]
MSDSIRENESAIKNRKLLIWAASLTLFFATLEIVYGLISGSLMIIGDGVHMGSDAISLILSLVAVIIASKAATTKKTFGYKRFEPIAAFVNGFSLILIPLYIIYEAVNRIVNPVEIIPIQMLVIGIIGLLINGLVGFILSKGSSNLNMRSAILHVVADMITSLSAVIVALAILFFDLVWLDPIGSIVTSIIIIRGGIKITKEAFHILMEGTPEGYSVEVIEDTVSRINSSITINQVKIWCINEAEVYALIRLKNCPSVIEGAQKIKKEIAKATNIPPGHIYLDVTSF